jgi:type II secretory pathway pseudopilin PulG
MRTLRSARGLSLIEATIILMVLSTLTAVIAPSVVSYTNDAKGVTAKKDVESIGTAIQQLLRDTGFRCLRKNGLVTVDCTVSNRVELLVSAGRDPRAITATDVTVPDLDSVLTQTTFNWLPDSDAPNATQTETMDEHLIQNARTNPYPNVASAGGGPRMKMGWRGAYLSGPISGDPWGVKYQADTIFLTVATDASDLSGNQTQEGLRETAWYRDVLVMSAGANQIVETSFGGTATVGASAGGDDIIYVIKGGTR